ncbi:hypothetical protein [Yersinia phage vB_YenM_P778]
MENLILTILLCIVFLTVFSAPSLLLLWWVHHRHYWNKCAYEWILIPIVVTYCIYILHLADTYMLKG